MLDRVILETRKDVRAEEIVRTSRSKKNKVLDLRTLEVVPSAKKMSQPDRSGTVADQMNLGASGRRKLTLQEVECPAPRRAITVGMPRVGREARSTSRAVDPTSCSSPRRDP